MPAFALSLGQAQQQQQQQQHDHKIRDYFEEEKKGGICCGLQGDTYHVNVLLGFKFALSFFCILEKEIQM